MWLWLLVSLVGMAGLLLLLLSIPVDLAFSFERGQKFRARARIGWLFGLVGKNIDEGTKQHKEGKSSRKARLKKPGKGGANFRTLVSLVRSGILGDILRFGRRILSTGKVRHLSLRLRFGLDDPAETGVLWGALAPVAGYADSLRPGTLALEPDFSGAQFSGQGGVSMRIVPLSLLPPILLFALNPSVLRAAWTIWRSRKK